MQNYRIAAFIRGIKANFDSKQFAMLMMGGIAILAMMVPDLAIAQALPWEAGTCKFAKAFTGPWLGWVAVIAIVAAAVAWGVGESNAPLQGAMRIAAGFSIAVSAAAVVGWFFPGLINAAAGC